MTEIDHGENIEELNTVLSVLKPEINGLLISEKKDFVFLRIEGVEDKSKKFISQPKRGIYVREQKLIEVNIQDILTLEQNGNELSIETYVRNKVRSLLMIHKGIPNSITLLERTAPQQDSRDTPPHNPTETVSTEFTTILEFRRLLDYKYQRTK